MRCAAYVLCVLRARCARRAYDALLRMAFTCRAALVAIALCRSALDDYFLMLPAAFHSHAASFRFEAPACRAERYAWLLLTIR